MCDICKSCLCLPHTKNKCPLKASFYCTLCSQYGHKTDECPYDDDFDTYEPVSPSCYVVKPRSYKPVLEVVDDPKQHCIRAMISSYGRAMSTKEKNLATLKSIAQTTGSRLIIHKSCVHCGFVGNVVAKHSEDRIKLTSPLQKRELWGLCLKKNEYECICIISRDDTYDYKTGTCFMKKK